MSSFPNFPRHAGLAVVLSALILAGWSCQLLPTAPTQAPATLPPTAEQTQAPVQTDQPATEPPPQTEPPGTTQPPVETLPVQTQPPVQTLPPVQTQPPAQNDGAFTLTRVNAIVKAGTTIPLPKVNDNLPIPFPDGSIVTVSENGEAQIEGTLEGNRCEIHVFFDTRLQKKSCPGSTFTGSNVSCIQDGSAIFDKCSNMLVQTPTGEFQLTGTWVEVSYRRDLQTSVLLVSDGQVEAYPITDTSTYARGDRVTVGSGQFLYTAPDDMLSQIEIPGMALRQPNDWGDMQALVQTYNLQRWYERGSQIAAESNVPFPDLSQTAGLPDLIIRLENRSLEEKDTPLINANLESIGVPVRATVTNQGDAPAGLFKISAEGTASDGTYIRAFSVPGESDVYYPHTAQELQPGESVVFDGLVFFPSSLAGDQVSITVQADSCAGEEFTPDECFVAEADEGNNQSEPITSGLAYPVR